MEREQIVLRVKEIIIEVLELEMTVAELPDQDLIVFLGMNSVDALEILINVENEFDIEIDEENLNTQLIDSLSKLVDYIDGNLSEENK